MTRKAAEDHLGQLGFFISFQHAAALRNERRREHALTEQILQEIWDAKSLPKSIGSIGGAKEMGEGTVANQPNESA